VSCSIRFICLWIFLQSLFSFRSTCETLFGMLCLQKSAHKNIRGGNTHEQACLNSFMSGYRLAHGIHQELLADQPPYNFEDEDERLACERLRGEEDAHG